jgi:hypothetical protein
VKTRFQSLLSNTNLYRYDAATDAAVALIDELRWMSDDDDGGGCTI